MNLKKTLLAMVAVALLIVQSCRETEDMDVAMTEQNEHTTSEIFKKDGDGTNNGTKNDSIIVKGKYMLSDDNLIYIQNAKFE